jgi:hypothetical protein
MYRMRMLSGVVRWGGGGGGEVGGYEKESAVRRERIVVKSIATGEEVAVVTGG